MKSIAGTAVAYFRSSSAANVGKDKDSLPRQRKAVRKYAAAHKLHIVHEYYDAGVSGTAPVQDRKAFSELLDYIAGNGARVILIESASRFARDIMIQEAGYRMLKELDIALVPVDSPQHFEDDEDNPTAMMVRQLLGVVSAFERAMIVQKLKRGRDKKIAETGRCGGPNPVPPEVVRQARRFYRVNPATHKRRSLRKVADELAKLGFMGPSGGPYFPTSIKRMVGR